MPTPLEVLKESQKEFDEEFTFEGSGDWVDVDKLDAHKIKSHLTSITIKLLESEIERVRGMKKKYLKHIDPKGITNEDVDSYNQAIDDQISYLSAQLSEIKKT